MGKDKIKLNGTLTRHQLEVMLRDMADSLAAGSLQCDLGGQSIEVAPRGELHVEMEAERKKGREKVSVELSWPLESDEE
ncbi:amphi-Trp domain-containing protein [Desulfohalobium retbaense]|uniref:Amphi-Trp domain-containing protein n=1 Tax=Desulfohalobium retbaense (strain ATCC 49708 / DSM 5692 / JCM 16813 / HR100) TaxID=485915 RepID=C8X291_DESRD|nr:amphi-Trp domain-containing protein [Desulfohalobium retbaense]ACV68414.1 conserved hypothetical protein [Desulfohalobium retbaense DSM 5692]